MAGGSTHTVAELRTGAAREGQGMQEMVWDGMRVGRAVGAMQDIAW